MNTTQWTAWVWPLATMGVMQLAIAACGNAADDVRGSDDSANAGGAGDGTSGDGDGTTGATGGDPQPKCGELNSCEALGTTCIDQSDSELYGSYYGVCTCVPEGTALGWSCQPACPPVEPLSSGQQCHSGMAAVTCNYGAQTCTCAGAGLEAAWTCSDSSTSTCPPTPSPGAACGVESWCLYPDPVGERCTCSSKADGSLAWSCSPIECPTAIEAGTCAGEHVGLECAHDGNETKCSCQGSPPSWSCNGVLVPSCGLADPLEPDGTDCSKYLTGQACHGTWEPDDSGKVADFSCFCEEEGAAKIWECF